MTPSLHYREASTQALCGFQLLEEGLKTYIQIYHNAVRAHLPPALIYKYAGADVQEASLGKLVSVFSKTSARDDLVKELRSLIKSRNELAHFSFREMLSADISQPHHLEKVAEFEDVTRRLIFMQLEIAREILLILSNCNSNSVDPSPTPEA